MTLDFIKMHGCGNDYIYFNCLDKELKNPKNLAVKLSNRHFGIGGDGIVMICPSDIADAKMRMFNNDGSEGKMCGNAIRCVGKYLSDNNIIKTDTITIETLSGVKTLYLYKKNNKVYAAKVNMGKAEFDPQKIPVSINCDSDRLVAYPINIDNKSYKITCVSIGNPHCVMFCNDVQSLDLATLGPKFENNKIFPDKVNTEFINVINQNTLEMRVWERGSGETMACGTGACAAVAAAVVNGFCKKEEDVSVKLLGGTLKIYYTDESIFMTGEAVVAFEGKINI